MVNSTLTTELKNMITESAKPIWLVSDRGFGPAEYDNFNEAFQRLFQDTIDAKFHVDIDENLVYHLCTNSKIRETFKALFDIIDEQDVMKKLEDN